MITPQSRHQLSFELANELAKDLSKFEPKRLVGEVPLVSSEWSKASQVGKLDLKHTLATDYDEKGVARIQSLEFESFKLQSGTEVKNIRLGYCVFAEGDAASKPLIVLHPALTGSPRAVYPFRTTQGDGWWNHCIGPDKFLDTRKYTVLCVDPIGGNGASSSAEELAEYLDELTFADGVYLTIKALESWGVKKVHSVIGGSIGGGQALVWLFQDRIKVKRIFDISGSFCGNGKVGEFFRMQAGLIREGVSNYALFVEKFSEHFKDLIGQSEAFDIVCEEILARAEALSRDFCPSAALSTARLLGFLRFVTPGFFQQKYQRYLKEAESKGEVLAKKEARQRLSSWLGHQEQRILDRFSPAALAQLCEMDAKSVTRKPIEVASAIKESKTKLIGFSINGDVLFDASIQQSFYQEIAGLLPAADGDLVSFYLANDEISGHDHFLTDKFLASVPYLKRDLEAL